MWAVADSCSTRLLSAVPTQACAGAVVRGQPFVGAEARVGLAVDVLGGQRSAMRALVLAYLVEQPQ